MIKVLVCIVGPQSILFKKSSHVAQVGVPADVSMNFINYLLIYAQDTSDDVNVEAEQPLSNGTETSAMNMCCGRYGWQSCSISGIFRLKL